ncbi:disintegrin and metalloproteinase domain-containing protein 5-like isoform X1 [Dipodomys merriami]|uniref:disintegrin and metalloproteinase domain-containing protein 5-like isoform X1 n=1 Tax=Dipodomys merriami TaxID=94247 RepID=UPI00384E6545
MVPLLVLLTALSGLQADSDTHKIYLQLTVPEKIVSPAAKRRPEHNPDNNLAYLITIAGKPYFIHLKKQSFLSPSALVYYYDQEGNKHFQTLLSQMNCNYNGYIAGFPDSLVTLNVCSGLRGTIQFKNISYGIKPMEAASGFVHMVYQESNGNTTNIPALGGDTYDWFNAVHYQARRTIEVNRPSKLYPRSLQINIVVEKNLFDYMGSDTKTVTQKVIQIIGLANTMLAQLKLSVVINSIEIWSNDNEIPTDGRVDLMLLDFLKWNHDHLDTTTLHISYLFVFQTNPIQAGAVFPGKICDENYDVGIAVYPDGFSLESYTIIFVQVLSLGLGLSLDTSQACYCPRGVCAMMPKAVNYGGIKEFSTCSLDEFKFFASQDKLLCLEKNLVERQTPASGGECGNGVVEAGEECDCGPETNCSHKSCCNPRDCTLKPMAICGSGECCTQDCRIKPINNLCRKAIDLECDFDEYCNGNQSECMPDTFVRNGHYCSNNEAFCYNGACRIFDEQCKRLIGEDAKGATFACYDEMNSRGDRFGNCGSSFCAFENVLCGKLVCLWPHKRLLIRVNYSVVYAHVREDVCVSVFKPSPKQAGTVTRVSSPGHRDDTFVEDGSICGPDMYCDRMRCKEVRYLINYQKCNVTRDCNDRGLCNNFNHCHCSDGYTPPECKPMRGGFGSIDDGHKITTKIGYFEAQPVLPKFKFQLIFYISVPVLVIILIGLVNQNKLRKFCLRRETETDRSEYSNSNSKISTSESHSRTTMNTINQQEGSTK